MARVDNLTNFLTDIATAIKNKTGQTTEIYPNAFDTEIQNIKPVLDGISQVSFTYARSSDDIQEVLNSINTANLKTYADMFNYCTNLTYIPSFEYNTLINNAMHMFNGCVNITSIPQYNYSQFRDKTNMFQGCRLLTDISNIEGHNIGNYMFANCYNLVDINYNMKIDGKYAFANCYNLINLPASISFNYYNTDYAFSNCRNLTEVTIDENQIPSYFYANGWFAYCYNLKTVNLPLNKMTMAPYLFIRCTNLESINGISVNNLNLNLPGLHSASYMFYGVPVDNLDLSLIGPKSSSPSHGDGSIRDFSYMFYGCSSLYNIINLNIGGATTTAEMFSSCTNLKNLPEINLDSIFEIRGMFNTCKNITNVHLKGIYNTTDWSMLFHNCNNLTNVYINDSRAASDMYSTFANCYNLTQVNVPWSPEINLYYTFERCWDLYWNSGSNNTHIPGFNIDNVVTCFCGFDQGRFDVDVTNLTKMKNAAYAFHNCYNVYSTTYDLDYSHIHNVTGMFGNALHSRWSSENSYLNQLNSINIGDASDLTDFFYNCSWFNVKYILGNNIQRTNEMFYNWNHTNFPNMDTSKVRTAGWMFSRTPIVTVPSNYDFSNLESGDYMFNYCPNLIEMNHSMPKLTSMKSMFYYCSNLTNYPTGINFAVMNNFYYTFYGTGVNYIPTNIKNVDNLYYAFAYCNNLTSVTNLSFDKVQDATGVFYNCSNLVTVNNISFNLLENASGLFSHLPNAQVLNNIWLPNATNVSCLFQNSNATYANVYCPKATNLSNMYQGANVETYVNSTVLSLLPNATTVAYMFADTNLSSVLWTGTNVQNGAGMYRNTSISSIPTYANFNNVAGLYQNCNQVTSIDILTIPYAQSASYLISNCANLTSINHITLNNVVYGGYLFAYLNAQTINQIDLPKMNSGYYFFRGSSNLISINKLNMPLCNNLYYAFYYCNNLQTINEMNVDTINITSSYQVRRMLYGCNNLSDNTVNLFMEMLLNTKIASMNLSNANSYSPFYYTNIDSTRYSTYLDKITARGWTY